MLRITAFVHNFSIFTLENLRHVTLATKNTRLRAVCIEFSSWVRRAAGRTSRKPARSPWSKGPCKRTQHCWPTTPNVVGPNNVVTCCVRLHGTTTMLALVGTCCVLFETGQTFRPMQTDATLLANNTQQCWELLVLVASVCMGLNKY